MAVVTIILVIVNYGSIRLSAEELTRTWTVRTPLLLMDLIASARYTIDQ